MDRTERFGLILSPVEKQALAQLAEREGGLSQAAMLRHLLREAARQCGFLPRDGTSNIQHLEPGEEVE